MQTNTELCTEEELHYAHWNRRKMTWYAGKRSIDNQKESFTLYNSKSQHFGQWVSIEPMTQALV